MYTMLYNTYIVLYNIYCVVQHLPILYSTHILISFIDTSYILYIIIYIYANVINYILF